jgi:hypothetical protein
MVKTILKQLGINTLIFLAYYLPLKLFPTIPILNIFIVLFLAHAIVLIRRTVANVQSSEEKRINQIIALGFVLIIATLWFINGHLI